jgi:hypothetical protein
MGNREGKREKLWSAIGSTARFEKLCRISDYAECSRHGSGLSCFSAK